MKVKMSKTKTIIMILSICLILSIGYIVFDKYEEKQQQEQLNIFKQGVEYGYEQAIIQLIQQLSTCQQVSLITAENQTINVIAVDCLK